MADFTPKEVVDGVDLALADGGVISVDKKKATKKKVEKSSEAISTDSGITFNTEVDSKPAQQNVKVRFARDYKGCIGGQRYFFKKGETANVPENVKRILIREEGLLMPL